MIIAWARSSTFVRVDAMNTFWQVAIWFNLLLAWRYPLLIGYCDRPAVLTLISGYLSLIIFECVDSWLALISIALVRMARQMLMVIWNVRWELLLLLQLCRNRVVVRFRNRWRTCQWRVLKLVLIEVTTATHVLHYLLNLEIIIRIFWFFSSKVAVSLFLSYTWVSVVLGFRNRNGNSTTTRCWDAEISLNYRFLRLRWNCWRLNAINIYGLLDLLVEHDYFSNFIPFILWSRGLIFLWSRCFWFIKRALVSVFLVLIWNFLAFGVVLTKDRDLCSMLGLLHRWFLSRQEFLHLL